MKNLIWKILVKPFVRVRSVKPVEQILVVSTTGLGDTIWATPAIAAIKNRYPNASISVLTRPLGKQILENSPHIDRFFLIPQRPITAFFSLLRTLKAQKFSAVYIFHASQRPIFPLCALLGAPVYGTADQCKGLNWCLSHPIPPRICHEIERRLDLTGQDGLENHKLDLFLTEEERDFASQFLKDLPRPIVAMQPFAKDSFKHWPEKNFVGLGRRLPGTLLITGSPDEIPKLTPITKAIAGAKLIAGKLTLRQIAAILSQIDLFITGDTGPMHIAFALNTPTLALFGPTDPALCGPHHAQAAHILRATPTCFPCIRRACAAPFCMRKLSINQVESLVKEILSCNSQLSSLTGTGKRTPLSV